MKYDCLKQGAVLCGGGEGGIRLRTVATVRERGKLDQFRPSRSEVRWAVDGRTSFGFGLGRMQLAERFAFIHQETGDGQ